MRFTTEKGGERVLDNNHHRSFKVKLESKITKKKKKMLNGSIPTSF